MCLKDVLKTQGPIWVMIQCVVRRIKGKQFDNPCQILKVTADTNHYLDDSSETETT